jgi:hypothetical protein
MAGIAGIFDSYGRTPLLVNLAILAVRVVRWFTVLTGFPYWVTQSNPALVTFINCITLE